MKQLEFNFPRERQLRILRECRLPAVRLQQGGVSAAMLKIVLRMIDSYARESGTCWASVDTLAAEIGCHRRTVQRALMGLRQLCLIIEQPRRHGRTTLHHRRIVWPNLEDFVPAKEDALQTATEPVDQPATPDPAPADPPRPQQQPQPAAAAPRQNKPAAYRTKATTTGGTQTIQKTERRTSTADGFPVVGLNGLADPELVQRCVDWAQLRGHLPRTEDARLAAFAFAARMHRKRKHVLNAPGFWKHTVQQGLAAVRSQLDDQHDWPAGRKLLEELQPQPQATG